MVKPQTKKAIFLAWFLIVPAGLWFTYQAYPPDISGYWIDLLAFLLLTSVVASMPIVINETFIFLIQWVALATFLRFGLFIEIIFAQIAVVVLLLKLRILRKGEYFRLPLNLIMFFFVSFLSGAFYYLVGGRTGLGLQTNANFLLLAGLYAVLSYTLNQIILAFNVYVIYKIKGSFFGKELFVETITTIITFPIGFVLYILYNNNQVGLLSLLFVGVPFVSLSMVFNLYYSSEKINEYLQKAAEIGHKMAEKLLTNDVVDLFIQKLTEMLPVDYAYILEANGDELKLIRHLESGNTISNVKHSMSIHEGISGMVWANRKAFLFKAKKDWIQYSNDYIPKDAESILGVPIIRSKKLIGVLLLASRKKRAYEKSQLMIIDILCSHFAIAIENARHYELTKRQSERCSLTNLYNYRYFENMLTEEYEKLTRFERKVLSLIILDIDHFKQVNDTYGHQSGNEILCELAKRLSNLAGGLGTVARYGGEEFVVLLPDVTKEEAYQMAELIRQSIANWPFCISQSLDQKHQQVKITASIGVATAPEDAEDPLALIRHADRALYVGAKRAGRNRVAEYSSC
ncbi:diguanylate cyclase (GGDEF)-like protein [Bacillus sp. SORGH_AS 510]|uniref:sensor domain-containing diguanylate cyclase n=1 Tax=Bacillus sp. SORGH_AS_0510 TaxID=3041771 RepID=UPI0027892CBF|nr:sensor domain-containing diguanylate cyclase [Bacillus sp. SORGH_AS_0510]MDQ1144855.1 diguanylate cyclase (GGDEF)-like protein [Bacillus sp. SORGH_AS_0510]